MSTTTDPRARVAQLVNDIRLNYDEGQGTLAEVADRIIEAVLGSTTPRHEYAIRWGRSSGMVREGSVTFVTTDPGSREHRDVLHDESLRKYNPTKVRRTVFETEWEAAS